MTHRIIKKVFSVEKKRITLQFLQAFKARGSEEHGVMESVLPMAGGWNWVIVKVPSNPSHSESMIPYCPASFQKARANILLFPDRYMYNVYKSSAEKS